MITKEDIIYAENLPSNLKSMSDRPWYFLGEVNIKVLRAISPEMICWMHDGKISPELVGMSRHVLVTSDMIKCMVCCGICPQCGCVYWARQAPPFERVTRSEEEGS